MKQFLIFTLFLSSSLAFAQTFSSKREGVNVTNHDKLDSSDNMLLNTACKYDSEACDKGKDNTNYKKVNETEKRSVNKLYGRLNQRTTPLTKDCFQLSSAHENQADHHQQLTQNKINDNFTASGEANAQVNAQRALRNSHILRQDTALIEGSGWGASTICQGSMMAYGIIPRNINNSLDFAASGGLALHHSKKYRRNVAYSNNLENLLKKLPDGQNCKDPNENPTCFCSKPENLNHAACLPEEYVSRRGGGKTPIGCVDAKGSVDPKCECSQGDNKCADYIYKALFHKHGFGKYANHEAFAVPNELFRGQLDPDLHKRVDSKRAKFGFRLLRKSLKQVEKRLSKVYKPRKLNSKQKAEADYLAGDGLPPLLANYFASQPEDPKAREKFKAFLKQNPEKTRIKKHPRKKFQIAKNTPSVPSGQKLAVKNLDLPPEEEVVPQDGLEASEEELSLEKEREIASLLDDPQNLDGQIHKDPSKSIFKIVTYRYRVSGFPRLGQELIRAYGNQ